MRLFVPCRYSAGWEPSLAAIEGAAAAESQPVDGLIGFSQGATAAALYLAALQHEGKPLPRFAILARPLISFTTQSSPTSPAILKTDRFRVRVLRV
jgi:acetyl esterase/lipase